MRREGLKYFEIVEQLFVENARCSPEMFLLKPRTF